MNIQFSYKVVSEKDKKFLEDYTDKKIERIKTLIQENNFNNAFLKIRCEKFTKKQAFKIELIFNMPGQNFISSEDDHTVIEALDLAFDKLIIQLRKYRDEQKEK